MLSHMLGYQGLNTVGTIGSKLISRKFCRFQNLWDINGSTFQWIGIGMGPFSPWVGQRGPEGCPRDMLKEGRKTP